MLPGWRRAERGAIWRGWKIFPTSFLPKWVFHFDKFYHKLFYIVIFILFFVAIDHEGKVQKDLHNNDLEYIKYKFFYNDDEERKWWTQSIFFSILKQWMVFYEIIYFLTGFKQAELHATPLAGNWSEKYWICSFLHLLRTLLSIFFVLFYSDTHNKNSFEETH